MSNKTDKFIREEKIEKYLEHQARLYGGVALKLEAKGSRGFMDRTIFLPGGWVAFAELKRPVGGKVSVQQRKHAERLTALGYRVYFPKTFKEVDSIFALYERRLRNDNSNITPDADQTTTA